MAQSKSEGQPQRTSVLLYKFRTIVCISDVSKLKMDDRTNSKISPLNVFHFYYQQWRSSVDIRGWEIKQAYQAGLNQ